MRTFENLSSIARAAGFVVDVNEAGIGLVHATSLSAIEKLLENKGTTDSGGTFKREFWTVENTGWSGDVSWFSTPSEGTRYGSEAEARAAALAKMPRTVPAEDEDAMQTKWRLTHHTVEIIVTGTGQKTIRTEEHIQLN